MRGVCIRLGQEGQGEGYALGLGRKFWFVPLSAKAFGVSLAEVWVSVAL